MSQVRRPSPTSMTPQDMSRALDEFLPELPEATRATLIDSDELDAFDAEPDPLDAFGEGPLVSGGMVFTVNDEHGVTAYADPALIAVLPDPVPPVVAPSSSAPAPRTRPGVRSAAYDE